MNDCLLCNEKSCAVALLDEKQLQILSGNCTEISYKKGQMIFKQDSLTTNVIYLKKGLIKEYLIEKNQKEQIVQIIKSRSYLGLSSMIGYKNFHYTYSALEDSILCFIDSSVFKELLRQNGLFSYEILMSVCHENINNYHRCISRTNKQTYGRVADALLYFSRTIYESNTFTLPLTYTEFAAITSNTRESVNRTLLSFKKEGIVNINDRLISIIQPDELERISKTG